MAFTMSNAILRALTSLVLILLTSALGPEPPAGAAERSDTTPTLALVVTNRSAVPEPTLARALNQTSRLFAHAGIVAIVLERATPNRPVNGAHGAAPFPKPLTIPVSIVDERHAVFRALPPQILGAVVQPSEGPADAVILADRVGRLAAKHEVDPGRLLGHVIAHEVAHFLLPHGHAVQGLMRADWQADDIRLALRGQLRFTPSEARHLRDALTAARATLTVRR
jgi:hypothetical protein